MAVPQLSTRETQRSSTPLTLQSHTKTNSNVGPPTTQERIQTRLLQRILVNKRKKDASLMISLNRGINLLFISLLLHRLVLLPLLSLVERLLLQMEQQPRQTERLQRVQICPSSLLPLHQEQLHPLL